MKKLLLVALFALTSVAGIYPTVNDSWDSINDNVHVMIDTPHVKLDNGPMTTIFFTCLEGDKLRTKRELTKCVKWEDRRDSRKCIETVNYYGYAALEGTRTRCTKYKETRNSRKCVETEEYSYSIPTNYDINVYKIIRRGGDRDDARGKKLFTKSLEVEYCK